MGLVYHNGKFIPEQNIRKATEEEAVLRLLRSFLDANEPGLVRILVNTWQSQGKAITYKELREAILNGDISPEYLEDWMQDYSRLVTKHMQPAWEKAIEAAAEELHRRYPTWHFNPMGDSVRTWTANHAAEFVTNVTTAQIEGLRAVVQRAAVLEDLSVDELSRAIRPMIGLTKQQTAANLRFYENLRAHGIPPKKARESSLYYSARQHRHRAYQVARTELATAYNTGAYEGTKQAQAAGLIGEVVKVWCTADDERVCKICGPNDGVKIPMNENFSGAKSSWSTKLHPPLHPACRCALIIEEISPPKE